VYFLWQTREWGYGTAVVVVSVWGGEGMELKKLDIFQSKQKGGSNDVKSDQTEPGVGS